MSNSEKVADLLMPGQHYLLERINETNGTSYTVDQLTETDPAKKLIIGAPRPSADESWNTDIDITFPVEPKAGESDADPVTGEIYYERFDLGRLFAKKNIKLRNQDYVDTRDLILPLLEEVRVAFDPEDLAPTPIPDGPFPKDVIIRADALSLRFVGQFSITLLEGIEPDTSIVEEPAVVPNVAPAPGALKYDGTLVIGEGNPSTNLIVASNGEIEVAGGARLYKVVQTFPSVDGKYILNIGEHADWNLPYSFNLFDTRNGDKLTDLYDCSLKIVAPGGGVLNFKLVRRYGRLHFVDSANELIIDDVNTYNEDQTLYQDVQRVTFYKGKLGSTLPVNAAGSPYGSYDVEIKAVRKNGSFDPVVVAFVAEISGGFSGVLAP